MTNELNFKYNTKPCNIKQYNRYCEKWFKFFTKLLPY